LKEDKSKENIEKLISLLADDKTGKAATDMLVNIGEPVLGPVLEALRAPRTREMYDWLGAVLYRLGPVSVEPLIGLLEDLDSPTPMLAVSVLGRLGDKRAVLPLINALKDKSEWIRWRAIESLYNLRDERAVGPLIERLRDRAHLVRGSAVEAMREMGTADALVPLQKCLNDKYPGIRQAAKEAIDAITSREEGKK
jgi:HEAT repeat protein